MSSSQDQETGGQRLGAGQGREEGKGRALEATRSSPARGTAVLLSQRLQLWDSFEGTGTHQAHGEGHWLGVEAEFML